MLRPSVRSPPPVTRETVARYRPPASIAGRHPPREPRAEVPDHPAVPRGHTHRVRIVRVRGLAPQPERIAVAQRRDHRLPVVERHPRDLRVELRRVAARVAVVRHVVVRVSEQPVDEEARVGEQRLRVHARRLQRAQPEPDASGLEPIELRHEREIHAPRR